jgi:hypothetical protein
MENAAGVSKAGQKDIVSAETGLSGSMSGV